MRAWAGPGAGCTGALGETRQMSAAEAGLLPLQAQQEVVVDGQSALQGLTQDLADHVPCLKLLVEGGVPPCVLNVHVQLNQAADLQAMAQVPLWTPGPASQGLRQAWQQTRPSGLTRCMQPGWLQLQPPAHRRWPRTMCCCTRGSLLNRSSMVEDAPSMRWFCRPKPCCGSSSDCGISQYSTCALAVRRQLPQGRCTHTGPWFAGRTPARGS